MLENINNKVSIIKLYTREIKEVHFYLEYDPFHITQPVNAKIEDDRKYTVEFNFRGEDHYIETCNKKLWDNEDLLIDYVVKAIIASEAQRVNKIKGIQEDL